ncbi:MAG: hypothetical protein WAW39_25920 [Prosthecobacter sp.]|uniref:hypothetical protein n=1 Tax=Prosthecobacter sp. TaxID=1965333 RepID=UPI003BB21D0D
MNTLTRRFFLPALAATLLLGTAGARAAAGGIQDDGAFFSEFAKVNATGTINDVSARLHKDIAVQTFATVPEDMKATVIHPDKAATNRGFSQWAEQLARTKKVNGVFILLVKQPAHLQVVVGTDTQRQAFTLTDRVTLIQRMLEQLRNKKNDDALIDAVNFISTTMSAHRNGAAAPVSSKTRALQKEGGSSWLPTIGIVLLIWVGFSLIRGLFRSMSGGGGGVGGGMGQPGYGGGGGFFQNMMGSMFGAAAGMWMYDNFFGSHSSASSLGADPTDTSHSDGGFSGTDTDYTSSGGSFGDDSGGGFDGGGDSGGGDFGGGGDF